MILEIEGLEAVCALAVAFVVSVILSPIVIPFLRRLKVGQTERKEGVQSHLQKAGTPTMGGLIILISLAVSSLFFVGRYPAIVPVLLLTLGFGILGFLDDFLKVMLRRSDGLLAWQKMLGQFLITTVFLVYILLANPDFLLIRLPFSDEVFSCRWITVPLVYFAVIGTVNGVNFTDGLDGLAASVTTVAATFFTVVSLAFCAGIAPLTAAMMGALLGFLLFNVYPAKVFMGDTGSLALGGFVVGCAYALQIPWVILIVGLIYLVEVLSVILQVTYFKITHGKRLFKMAPIHHHFELCGWSETRVVALFTVITALLCLTAVILLN